MINFNVYKETFEVKYSPYSREIFSSYNELRDHCPVLVGSFDNLDSARKVYDETRDTIRTKYFYHNGVEYIQTDMVYIEEAEYTEDGEFLDVNCWWNYAYDDYDS